MSTQPARDQLRMKFDAAVIPAFLRTATVPSEAPTTGSGVLLRKTCRTLLLSAAGAIF